MPPATARARVRAYAAWPVIDIDLALVDAAVETSIAHQLSIWDAMVIPAARRAEADTLYAEDLSNGQRFGTLTAIDPFLA